MASGGLAAALKARENQAVRETSEMFGSSDQDDRTLYELIRMGDHTDQIVVDPETAIESFFASIGALGLITLFIGTPALMFLKHSDLAWKLVPFGLLFGVAGLVLSRLTEVNYRLDLREKTVSLYRRFAGWESSSPVCDFSEIALVTGNSKSWRRSTGNNNHVWETRYGRALADQSVRRRQDGVSL